MLTQRTRILEVPKVLINPNALEIKEPWKGTGMHVEAKALPTLWLNGNH